jgi:hypothetical protein
MEKTPAQVRAMKKELQAWMKKHDLTHDTGWRDLQDHYGDKEKGFPYPHYLVLWFEGDLYDVLWPLPDHPNYPWQKQRRLEFEALIEKHGCWFEFENNTTLCIMDKEERKTS